ncbi:MAG TPA: hypothetical protein PK264_04525, partial [Hyphomicrobiaceae bacterium]|nr:hypothetical protein [Hyphomicrobiaceae bacterium]
SIADAMKREAGVTTHHLNEKGLDGLAWLGTGNIYSPEGRNIRHLITVAHECGHIFLQSSGPGLLLPSHVQEMEAESYAHQALVEYGMIVPKQRTEWGRAYVGTWVEKDRARGIPIDPRVIEYVAGFRSPYEPLRMVPETWRQFRALPPPASPPVYVPPIKPEVGTTTLPTWQEWLKATTPQADEPTKPTAGERVWDVLAGVCWWGVWGLLLSRAAFATLDQVFPIEDYRKYDISTLEVGVCLTIGLATGSLGALWRSVRAMRGT